MALRFVAILSFYTFVLGAIFLGGDALNGRAENGRYFLSWHGRLTEVTELTFTYSWIHALTTFGIVVLAGIAGWMWRPRENEIRVQRYLVGFVIASTAFLAWWKYGF